MFREEVLFTGFPGFIGRRLVRELLKEGGRIHCLVQPQAMALAHKEKDDLCRQLDLAEDLVQLYPGDITRPDLGLGPEVWQNLTALVSQVYHLAAVYDLAVPEELARRVNVDGTDHLNKFCLSCPGLKRYIYFSTCYVSGSFTGVFRGEDLEAGQSFKNHYESTKYAAEVMVREIMDRVPVTIIRPSIVVGDSKTGEIPKFDGPGFIMAFARKFSKLPLPYVGKGNAKINLVPVDYLVSATIALAKQAETIGKTLQLADPRPHLARDVYGEVLRLVTGRLPRWTLAEGPVVWLHRFAWVRSLTGLELETFAYQTHQVEYDASETSKYLEGTGIVCPDLMEILPVLVGYFLQHSGDRDHFVPARVRVDGGKAS